MKILHFYKTYFPETIGGVEQVIRQIAKGTSLLGVESEILSLSPAANNSTVKIDGHIVHRLHSNIEVASTPFSLSAFRKFPKLTKGADIIHYHFPFPFADLLHLATKMRKPTVVTYHSDIVKQKNWLKIYRPLMLRFLSKVDHIVATSPNYLETSSVLNLFSGKTSVIPIGLNKNSYPKPHADKLSYWQKQIGPTFFLFIGVMRYYKGLHILVEAAREAIYPIVIAGTGPMENELKEQTSKLGLQNIYFIGQVPDEDKVALLELCCGIVLPSHLRSEASGVSLMEGAMFGKPMVSCEIGTGTSFINIGNKTGIVVPPNNPEALRQAMNYLWEHPKEASAMGQRAKERYWKNFTAERMAQSYFALYKKLLNI